MAEATLDRFTQLADALGEANGVLQVKPGKSFGQTALQVNNKIFARISLAGDYVVKLPEDRVDTLVRAGAGRRFDAHRAGPSPEWMVVFSESGHEWLELAREALRFVRSLP